MVLSTGFALVRGQKIVKKRGKQTIFAMLGVLRKKLQAETMRRGGFVRGQPLHNDRDLGPIRIL
jgi:hypothetical protein